MNDIHLQIDKEAFRKKIEKLQNIPTLPHLMLKFTNMAKDPSVSMAALGEEIAKDQTLTSKLLKLVNSAFYGFPGRISTVTQALVLLGLDAVKGLIITSNVFDGLTPEAFPLWRHSMLTSLACRHLCNMLNLSDVEEVAVAGLLHDIGKVILIIEAPNEYRALINKSMEMKIPIWKMEDQIFGFNHAKIANWLCEKWTLPEKLEIPMSFHHDPLNDDKYMERTFVVTFANTFIKALGIAGERKVMLEDIPSTIIEHLKLERNHLEILIEKIEPEIETLKDLAPGDLE